MILIILLSTSFFLIRNHINSIIHAKSFVDEELFTISKNTKVIYNAKGDKLYADFIFSKNNERVAVLYIGYGMHHGLTEKVSNHYLNSGFNVVTICANGFFVSGGKNKVDDHILTEELLNWLKVIEDIFGTNAKIYLHGFAYTALSVLNCSNKCYAVFADNTHIFPTYNYKNIKLKLIKNKSRAKIPEINTPVFYSSNNTFSKEAYKLYELSVSTKTIYTYDVFDADEYICKTKTFIKRLEQPEE